MPSSRDTAADWAICCSGGGIRSATYCLGGLQSLEEGGLLGRAKWIVGVSGGSYIAASRALVAHGLGRGGHQRPAYARATPEEQNLRNNTHYIAPDAKTVLVAALSLLLGAAVTAILALAPVYALSHAWGWLLRGRGVLAWSGGHASASVTGWTWWLAPAIAAAVTVALFGYWWATLGTGAPGRGARRARWVGWAAAITAGLALLMLAAPLLIAWLDHSTGALGTISRFFGFGGSGTGSPATFAGLVAAVTAIAGYCRKALATVKPPAAAAGSPPGGAAKLAAWARGTLTPWLASLVIVAAGAFAALLWIDTAARAGYSLGQLVPCPGRPGHHARHPRPGRHQPHLAARFLPVAARRCLCRHPRRCRGTARNPRGTARHRRRHPAVRAFRRSGRAGTWSSRRPRTSTRTARSRRAGADSA